MADANRTTGMGTAAFVTGLALLVPLGWSRIVRASNGGKIPRLARAMPGMGRRKPAAAAPPSERAPAPAAAAAPPPAAPPPPVAPPTAPEPHAPPPAALAPPSAPAMPEILTPLTKWVDGYAGQYKEQLRAALGPFGPDAPLTAMRMCKAIVAVLPGELIDKLEEDIPAIKPELALCERAAAEAPPPPAAAPPPPAAAPPPVEAPPAAIAPRPAPPVVAEPAPAPAVPPTPPAAAPEPAPVQTAKPAPAEEVPPPPAPPPVPQATDVTPPAPTSEEEGPAAPPAPPIMPPGGETATQLEGPKPPAGFDAVKARRLAPQLAKSVKDKKYSYSRRLAKEFQTAAGIAVDGLYGGGTHGALEAFGVRRPPRALFKPSGSVPYKWTDYV